MLDAEPVKVRLREGNARGFLVLRPPAGEPIGYGELRQKPVGSVIQSRLLLNFKDGSVYDETVTFSQKEVFRLEAYRLVHRGASFPTAEISFDRKSGQYRAWTQEKKEDEEKTASGPLEMPPDLYNGMALTLLKNLTPGAGTTVQMAAFTPKPRLIKMQLHPEGQDRVLVGAEGRTAIRYLVKLEVSGLAGVIAPWIGKDPPDLRYWLVAGDVPAFARFEGAMYLNGPVWRLELMTVEWPQWANVLAEWALARTADAIDLITVVDMGIDLEDLEGAVAFECAESQRGDRVVIPEDDRHCATRQ
jgi:hypothetical protein